MAALRAKAVTKPARSAAWPENTRPRPYAEVQRDQVGIGGGARLLHDPAAIFGLSLPRYLPIPHLQQAIFELLHQLLPGAVGRAAREHSRTHRDATYGGLGAVIVLMLWLFQPEGTEP